MFARQCLTLFNLLKSIFKPEDQPHTLQMLFPFAKPYVTLPSYAYVSTISKTVIKLKNPNSLLETSGTLLAIVSGTDHKVLQT